MQYQLLNLFADGGWMMYPLLLCSLLALGVIIAKGWTLFTAHAKSSSILVTAEEIAQSGDVDGALGAAASTPGPAAAILVQDHLAPYQKMWLLWCQRRWSLWLVWSFSFEGAAKLFLADCLAL